MRGQRSRTSNEKLALGLFGGLAILALLGLVAGAVIPTGAADQIEPQTGALCLGPFVGALGAMALVWFRRRTGKLSAGMLAAVIMWFVGMTLFGWGIFNAFNPGDHTVLANLGYSVALCFAPALILSLLAIGAYWYGELREPAPGSELPERTEQPARGPEAAPGQQMSYAEIEERAGDYRRRIIVTIRQRKNGPLKEALRPILAQIDAWEARVRQLTRWLAAFDADSVVQRDLRETPAAMQRLESQLAAESDPGVRAQMNDTLAGYRAQEAQLEALQSAARQARWQLEEALSAMGLIYSQLQMLSAKELDSASARRISEDIQEQTNRLGDLLSSVSEVYTQPESQADALPEESYAATRVSSEGLDAATGV